MAAHHVTHVTNPYPDPGQPVPLIAGRGFDGSGYGLARRYPGVTRGTPYPLNQSSASTQTSTHNTQPAAATTSTSKKTSGQWTDNEIKLLLDYVESNCTLTTAR